jgi:SWI2/SNF2 ATPase
MPVLSEQRNIVVLADEARRSQYSRFAQNLVGCLPHALRGSGSKGGIPSRERAPRVVNLLPCRVMTSDVGDTQSLPTRPGEVLQAELESLGKTAHAVGVSLEESVTRAGAIAGSLERAEASSTKVEVALGEVAGRIEEAAAAVTVTGRIGWRRAGECSATCAPIPLSRSRAA